MLSLAVASAAIAAVCLTSHSRLMDAFFRLQFLINALLQLHPHNEIGGDIAAGE